MEVSKKVLESNQCCQAMAELLQKANNLGMDCTGYGELGYNDNSGNTYLRLEDYPFTLFISDFNEGIYAMYTDFNDGEETEIELTNESLDDLYSWVKSLEEEEEEEV